MNVTFQHRFSAGLQVQFAYTFSKALSQSDASQVVDYSGSGTGTLRYAHDLSVSKGLSGFNVGQRLSTNYSYDIPLGKGLTGVAGHALSGWQWTGILTLQDGQPFNITGGVTSNFLNGLGYTQSPNAVAGFKGVIQGGPNQYFNPQAFYIPTPLELGNVGRNTLIGPGLAQWDTGLTKNTNLTERLQLQFRGEFFNLLNRANFAKPASTIFAGNGARVGNAGLITSTVGSSRQVQFSLRLMF